MSSGYQRGLHMPYCVNQRCEGCLPSFPTLPVAERGLPVLRPSTDLRLPAQLAPSAREVLLAFYDWLKRLPAETLADEVDWTPERLVDMFILEASNADS